MLVIPRTLSTNRTINKESTISRTTAIESGAMESSLFEVINSSSNDDNLLKGICKNNLNHVLFAALLSVTTSSSSACTSTTYHINQGPSSIVNYGSDNVISVSNSDVVTNTQNSSIPKHKRKLWRRVLLEHKRKQNTSIRPIDPIFSEDTVSVPVPSPTPADFRKAMSKGNRSSGGIAVSILDSKCIRFSNPHDFSPSASCYLEELKKTMVKSRAKHLSLLQKLTKKIYDSSKPLSNGFGRRIDLILATKNLELSTVEWKRDKTSPVKHLLLYR
ncbi:hypothetical protein INT45_011279 [Circinella minor]|uniref:Uncharacterized protein n=1 Tax=Circinella minor TaxID=1195481 RepID=A0A8H7VFR2_9FUNG|nr:hypothetical protein INT45_011279 [Circinella minor]